MIPPFSRALRLLIRVFMVLTKVHHIRITPLRPSSEPPRHRSSQRRVRFAVEEASVVEGALPLDLVRVRVAALAVHSARFPPAHVGCTVGPFIRTFAREDAFFSAAETLGDGGFTVEDRATGVSLDTLVRSMLVPSSSTKGLGEAAQQVREGRGWIAEGGLDATPRSPEDSVARLTEPRALATTADEAGRASVVREARDDGTVSFEEPTAVHAVRVSQEKTGPEGGLEKKIRTIDNAHQQAAIAAEGRIFLIAKTGS